MARKLPYAPKKGKAPKKLSVAADKKATSLSSGKSYPNKNLLLKGYAKP